MQISINKTELAGALAALGKLVSRTSIVKIVFSFKKRFRDTLIDNPDLLEDLLPEMPGILNWSLRGLFKLFNQPLKRIPQTKESLMALTELKQQA